MTEQGFDGAARYYAKREAGISPIRKDGSWRSPEVDRQAAAAEEFAAESLGCAFNAEITGAVGDGGIDFSFPLTVDAVWLGTNSDGLPRLTGHLIIDPAQPSRHADVYVLVSGSIEQGFAVRGWATHRHLIAQPQQNFGYGMRYALHTRDLFPIEKLKAMRRAG